MKLGLSPLAFFGRVVVLFAATYAVWGWLAPAYTQVLAACTTGLLWLVETSSDPNLHRATQVWVEGTGIFYRHRLFPQAAPPGIPADWVQANMVLLIPLMLATPAPTWASKAKRFALALVLALLLQVLGIVLTIKAFHAYDLGAFSARYYSDTARWLYGFADAFTQSMDTQLFPFVIWAGIHFRQLLGWPKRERAAAEPTRADRRRKDKKKS